MGNGAFGSIRSAMLAIMPGMWIMFITTRSSMGSSPKSVIGRIRRFTVMSGSVCIQTTGRVLPWLEPKAAMVNLTNNPRAHSAPYVCSKAGGKIIKAFGSNESRLTPDAPEAGQRALRFTTIVQPGPGDRGR